MTHTRGEKFKLTGDGSGRLRKGETSMNGNQNNGMNGRIGGFALSSIFRGAISTIASISFVIYVGYLGWMSLSPQKPVPDPERRQLADAAILKIADQLKNGRGEIRSAVLVHFANDPSDYFSDALRLNLDRSGLLNLDDRTLAEKVRNKLRLRNTGCATLTEALEAARGSDAQGVLWGTLDRFESSTAGAVVKGSWQLADAKTGQVVCSGEILEDNTSLVTEKIARSVQQLKEKMQRGTSIGRSAGLIPWYIRFLGFVLLVLLLPVVTISFIRTMVAKRSNKINAFMLGIYTVVDAIFAFFMIGAFDSAWSVFFFLLAAGLALVYNYCLMCYALKLES